MFPISNNKNFLKKEEEEEILLNTTYKYDPIKLIEFRKKIQNNKTESNNQIKEIISIATKKDALFFVALCIRNGADMNQYIPFQYTVGSVTLTNEIHILSYAFSKVKEIKNYEDGYPATLIKLMIAGGSDPQLKNYKNDPKGITVQDYLINNKYINYLSDRKTNDFLNILLDNTENIEKSVKNNKLIIRSLCSDTRGLFLEEERNYWVHNGLLDSIKSLNLITFQFYLDNKLALINYPLLSELILMPYTEEKMKMIEIASESQIFDDIMIQILDKITENTTYNNEVITKLIQSINTPYWFKACKEEYLPVRIKETASYLGIDQPDTICNTLSNYSIKINSSTKGKKEVITVLQEKNAQIRRAKFSSYNDILENINLREEILKRQTLIEKEQEEQNNIYTNNSLASIQNLTTTNSIVTPKY